ncbi:phosphatase PAP2 family protein [Dermatophilaceae bacterium Sec6.4]
MDVVTAQPTGQRPAVRQTVTLWRSLVAVVVVCALVLVALVTVLVYTRTGARYDHRMEWALGGPPWLFYNIESRLQQVSVLRVGIAGVLLALVALGRRRVGLAAGALVLIGGATVTTQVLKNEFIYRLPGAIVDDNLPSMPSGHATVGVSISLALLIVLPASWQRSSLPVCTAVGYFFGVGTVIGHWHRPGDVLAALAVCLGWTAVAFAVVAALGGTRRDRSISDSASARMQRSLAQTLRSATAGVAFVSLLLLAWGAQTAPNWRAAILGFAAVIAVAVGTLVVYVWVARTADRFLR